MSGSSPLAASLFDVGRLVFERTVENLLEPRRTLRNLKTSNKDVGRVSNRNAIVRNGNSQ
jgi:hypothetical protein